MIRCADCKYLDSWQGVSFSRESSSGPIYHSCEHESCFSYAIPGDPVFGNSVIKTRVDNYRTKNKNNDCADFESTRQGRRRMRKQK